jgi:hypothetical protein
MRERMQGKANPRYNGGLCFHRNRWLISCRDGSVVPFARAVVEADLRRHLRSDEIVHHISGDSADDRRENLHLTTRAEHVELHRDELLAARGLTRKAVPA